MGIPTSINFVAAVMAHLRASGPTDLAKKMRWADYNAPNNVGRWLRGTSAPNYEATMEMLEKCGWLTKTGRDFLARDHLAEAAQAADQAVEQAQQLRRRPQDGRARGASK